MAGILTSGTRSLVNPRINRAHPLAEGLTLLWWGGQPERTVDGTPVKVEGSTGSIAPVTYNGPMEGIWFYGHKNNPAMEMRGLAFSGDQRLLVASDNPPIKRSSGFTIAFISAVQQGSPNTVRVPYAQGNEVFVGLNMDSTYTYLGGYATLNTVTAGTQKVLGRWSDGQIPINSIPHIWLFSTSNSAGTGMIMYQGASLSKTWDQGVAGSFTQPVNSYIGNHSNGTRPHIEGLFLVATWDRKLSELEGRIFSADPFGLMEGRSSRAFVALFDSTANGPVTGVNANLTSSYTINSVVNASLVSSYNVLSAVNASLAATYNVQVTAGDVQWVYPTSDISVSNWMASTGTDLYAMVDEEPYSDSDFIYTEHVGSTFEFDFGVLAAPPKAGTVSLDIRIPPSVPLATAVTIRLKEGTTQRAQWTLNIGQSGTVNLTMTTGERDSITDWNNLRVYGSS